jgi:hypothetical protein
MTVLAVAIPNPAPAAVLVPILPAVLPVACGPYPAVAGAGPAMVVVILQAVVVPSPED